MIEYPAVVIDPHTGRRTKRPGALVRRDEYVPDELDAPLLVPDESGRPRLRLVLIHDCLVLASTIVPDALINPKSPHLRSLNLYASCVRGSEYLKTAFEQVDHRPGAAVDLYREPDNPYDPYAVQMRAPGARTHFGYVQRGKVPAVAQLMDEGVDMAGITMREGSVLLGPCDTLEHLRPVASPWRSPRSIRDWLLGRVVVGYQRRRDVIIGWSEE